MKNIGAIPVTAFAAMLLVLPGLCAQTAAKKDAKPIVVPHRANRAVVFDSDLFHETDTIRFKDGYQNRRINVTMLYGRRAFYGG